MKELWLTPGPTQVRENVRLARAQVTGNADLDPAFYDFYKETCELLSRLMHTKNESFLLSGEGILGLEAACASLTQPGDRVLVIDNGVFGRGFQDFVRIYGGQPVLYTTDYHRPVDVEGFRAFLEKDHDFVYATLVHCDTPSGVTNDIHALCPLLKEYGILTVVDSVAGMFGEEVDVDRAQIDILCGGSQKALSAPTGMTLVTVSEDAFAAMENRKTPIASFYANLLQFRGAVQRQWMPYTMPESDIRGVRQALENVAAETDIVARHARIAAAGRMALTEGGLELYLESGFSNNITAVRVPKGLTDKQILQHMREHYGVMLAGSFDYMAGKVLRIGHMGENANPIDVCRALDALGRTLADLGQLTRCDLVKAFAVYERSV